MLVPVVILCHYPFSRTYPSRPYREDLSSPPSPWSRIWLQPLTPPPISTTILIKNPYFPIQLSPFYAFSSTFFCFSKIIIYICPK